MMDWINAVLVFLRDNQSAIIGSVCGALVSVPTTLYVEHRKAKWTERRQQKQQKAVTFDNRPEMEIVGYDENLSSPDHEIKENCDIECVLLPIQRVAVEGAGKKDAVYAFYDKAHLQPDHWHSVVYTFRNAGKTDISTFYLITNCQKKTCLFSSDTVQNYAANNLLEYSYLHDQKIRVDRTVTVKISYPEKAICTNTVSATLSIGMEDDRGHYWVQPLFAPEKKVYDSYAVSRSDFYDAIKTNGAEECFKKPWLW